MGQTSSVTPSNRSSAVYPHLRGADGTTGSYRPRDRGVSPPAWGRRCHTVYVMMTRGCIPTCVGQTMATPMFISCFGVYPHLRGADGVTTTSPNVWRGVSPPAWGRLVANCSERNRHRCIPTCVGQTLNSQNIHISH